VRSIDASKKHPVTLTFLLDRDVSPREFAQDLAAKCGGDVLQPGEGILVKHAKIACVVIDETLSLPSFGYAWYRSPKKPKRPKLTRNRCR
jgi:hypothetical protein